MTKTTNLVLAALLVTSLVGVATPTTAHVCKGYEGCDPDACHEGENHEHTDYNYVTEDEYCKSEAPGDTTDEPDCRILNIEVPDIICNGPALFARPI